MSVIEQQVRRTLMPGMTLPKSFCRLFDWIEARGLYVDTDGGRLGFLYPQERIAAEWTDDVRPGGTDVTFLAEGNVNMKYWFGTEDPDVLGRLCVFAHTGAEGSMAAFWLDDAGRQRIVHLGSGSGSVLVCVLADDPVDFLRLLAIGYDEICWPDQFSVSPNRDPSKGEVILPNLEYQEWVRGTFAVEIPRTALEVVRYPSEMTDPVSPDPFHQWVNGVNGHT